MEEQRIDLWTEAELIQHVYHELNQNVTSAFGLAELLSIGELGFANEKQKEIIEHLHKSIRQMVEVNRWMRVWIASRENRD